MIDVAQDFDSSDFRSQHSNSLESPLPSLTDRQRQVYDFICRSIQKKRRPPSLQEICNHIGARSKNGAIVHLDALEKKGYIEREPLIARGIKVTDLAVYRQPYSIPILGRVSAGPFLEACELLDWLCLGDLLGDDEFEHGLTAVQVEGPGMLSQLIADGDYLIRRDDPSVQGSRNVLLWRPIA